MLNLIRYIYHLATMANARSSGARVGKNVRLSATVKIKVSGGSSITISDEAIISPNCQIDAHGGSNIYIGPHVHLGDGVRVHAHHGANIIIEEGCSFNYGVAVFALESIKIGKHSILGPHVYVSDHNHQFSRDDLIKNQGFDTHPVIIGSDVWLGIGVSVLKGACIGEGSVIAAGGLVNKTVPDYEVWAGIPAKKTGDRKYKEADANTSQPSPLSRS